MDHDHKCRLLLGGQMACAGQAWSCTSPHADVTQVAIPRRPYRLLLPMMWLYSSGHTETRNSRSIRGVFDEPTHNEKISR
jgi:hypothetical protein